MSFKVVKSGCCVGRCALACDSATRYIRLSSSRSQAQIHTQTHTQCMYVCAYVHSHASWHCLRVRSGRKISDPELNRHYFQLTRKQSRSYTLLHTRTRTHTCTHTHTHAGRGQASRQALCKCFERLLKSGFNMKIPHYEVFVALLYAPTTHKAPYTHTPTERTAFVFV